MSKQKSKFIKRLILCLLLIGSLTPFYFVKAQFGFEIITAPSVWAMQTLAKIYVGLFVSFYAFKASLAILKWVISPEFLQIPGGYTHNVFVLEGWRIVRDIVNMLFILVVIAIGLGVALRIREYEIKKTVPRLIAMALLINFTPLICGVIIDASNILMNFFLGAGAGGFDELGRMLESPLKTLAGSLRSVIEGVVHRDWQKMAWGLCFKPIMALAFNAFATLVILILAALFLARYLFLWLLTILSPLAFFCNILPQTQRVWRMWWEQFIQWCFVGVGASFFLYLAQRMIALRSSLWKQVPQQDIGLPGEIFLAAIPLSFLAAGYFATTYFAPMGAKQIIGLVEKGVKWPMTKAGRKKLKGLWEGVRRKTKGEAYRISGAAGTRMGRLKKTGTKWIEEGKEKGGVRGTLKRIAGWGLRSAATGGEMLGKGLKQIAVPAAQDEFARGQREGEEIKDEYTFKSHLKGLKVERRNKARMIGLIIGAIKSGKLKDFIKAGVIKPKTLEDAFRWSYRLKLKEAQKSLNKYFSADEEMLERFANVLDQETAHLPKGHKDKTLGGLTQEDKEKGYESYVEKIRASSLKTRKDFEDFWDRIEDLPTEKQAEAKRRAVEQITEMLHKGLLDREQLAHAGRVIGEAFVSTFENRVRENLEKDKLFYYKVDPRTKRSRAWIVRWMAESPVARELGMWLPEELQDKKIRKRLENIAKQAESRTRQFALPTYQEIQKARTPQERESLLEKKIVTPLAELQRDIWKAKREKDEEKQKILESTFKAIEQKAHEDIQRIRTPEHIKATTQYLWRGIRSFSKPSRARKVLVKITNSAVEKSREIASKQAEGPS